MNTTQIAELLETIATKAKNWYDIGEEIRKKEQETKDQSLLIFIYAFQYMKVEPTNTDYYEKYGPYAPIIEMQGKVFPPPLQAISDEDVGEWEKVLQVVTHPFLVSRLADLLWVKKWGSRPDVYARQAIDSYLQLLISDLHDLEKANHLIRALEISLVLKDEGRISQCIASIIKQCENEFSQGNDRPGISFLLLRALLDLPRERIPEQIDELLEKSFNFYLDNPWLTQTNIEFLSRRVSEEKKRELNQYLVKRWLEEAQKSSGIIKVTHLERALELARNFGLNSVAEEIRVQIQNIPESEMGMQKISVTTEIPAAEIEKFINQFTETENLEQSLIKFGSYGPPSGSFKENQSFVENLSKESPMQFLITQQIFDENNNPIKIGNSFEENLQFAIMRQEILGVQLFATLGFEIIDRLNKKFGFGDREKLIEFFTTPLIPKEISENIVKAFDYFFRGDYYVSSLLIIPSIETIFRNISHEIGIPTFREPIGQKCGRVKGLGELLHSLNGRMDEDWRRYFTIVLTEPIGLNYRNRICHGLLLVPEKYDAVVLFHIVCNLRLMGIMRTSTS